MPASELFTVLGLEEESSLQQPRELSKETLSGENKGLESPLFKSKVINSGGTVIVLTESDQQQRSVVGHSVQSLAQVEQPVRPYLTTYVAEQVSSPRDGIKVVTELREFKNEKKSDEANSIDGEGRSMEHSDYQLHNTGPLGANSPEQDGDFRTLNSHAPGSPRAVFKVARSPVGSMQNFISKEPVIRSKLPMQISLKTERNNNSLGKRTLSNTESNEDDGEQDETVVVEAPSSLGARYENVLFQKSQDYARISQDYARLSNDEDYIMHNRAKGKVH